MSACFSVLLTEANEANEDSFFFDVCLSSCVSDSVREVREIRRSFGVWELPSIQKMALKSSCDMNELMVVNIKEKK